MQNVRGFGHLHHKGRTPGGQVIRCADAGKNTVDGADFHVLRRNVTADIGQQGDQCRLPHIGTFTAHIGAGNDQHPALRRQVERVSDKRLIQYLFNHRVATFGNTDTGFIGKCRAGVIQRPGAFGQVNQHIQLRQRVGALL
ncbi:Uncharacterised protein [Salmonella enterica subsp. enterica serovar Bovismorbificans]|uniref:Uncharacterized protein n=1 Tax=Salmonella enterica subsp. enterica serovar Bovismorbificans TaxID=58097 RepID=A0A655CG69_SALET|nr:Uncharacterised protein [Salmonella enterica subsp. enterica serovar Bovismorbificans]